MFGKGRSLPYSGASERLLVISLLVNYGRIKFCIIGFPERVERRRSSKNETVGNETNELGDFIEIVEYA